MAASPLAEIDWDNLTDGKQSLVTALNLLEKMFGERMNVPALINCSGSVGTTFVNRYPFKSNSPDYGLATWPATWGPTIFTLGNIVRGYLSETKIAALLGGTTYNRFAPVLDDATIFSDNGITAYPSLEIINAVDIKTWYDILSSMKWIYSDYDQGNGGSNTTSNYDSSSMEGIVINPDTDPIVYNGIGGNPPVSQFATDEALLFSGPTSKATATAINTGVQYYHDAANFSGLVDSPPTTITSTILKGYNRFGITNLVNAGHTGQPQEFRSYGAMGVSSQDFSGRTTFSDYAASYPFNNGEVYQFGTPTRTNTTGNIYEYEVPFATPPTKPTGTVGNFSATFINAGGLSIFENWDLENGFEFYTP